MYSKSKSTSSLNQKTVIHMTRAKKDHYHVMSISNAPGRATKTILKHLIPLRCLTCSCRRNNYKKLFIRHVASPTMCTCGFVVCHVCVYVYVFLCVCWLRRKRFKHLRFVLHIAFYWKYYTYAAWGVRKKLKCVQVLILSLKNRWL